MYCLTSPFMFWYMCYCTLILVTPDYSVSKLVSLTPMNSFHFYCYYSVSLHGEILLCLITYMSNKHQCQFYTLALNVRFVPLAPPRALVDCIT